MRITAWLETQMGPRNVILLPSSQVTPSVGTCARYWTRTEICAFGVRALALAGSVVMTRSELVKLLQVDALPPNITLLEQIAFLIWVSVAEGLEITKRAPSRAADTVVNQAKKTIAKPRKPNRSIMKMEIVKANSTIACPDSGIETEPYCRARS